jgi:hypothetical protein
MYSLFFIFLFIIFLLLLCYSELVKIDFSHIGISDVTDEIIGRMTPAMAEIFSVSATARKLLQVRLSERELNRVEWW